MLDGITAHAVLVSGHWPGGPATGQPDGAIPAALPAAAAALLHVTDGDVLRLKDRVSEQYVRFVVTGLYRPRQVSSPYWGLNDIPLSGSSTASGFTTYGPLTVQAGAFAGPLTVSAGFLAGPAADGEHSVRRAQHRRGKRGRPAAGAAERAEYFRPSRSPPACPRSCSERRATWTSPARCWPSAPCCCSCSPRRPCSRWPGCCRPARGRVRHADGARRHPLAAGPADRGRGHPAVRCSPPRPAAWSASCSPGCSPGPEAGRRRRLAGRGRRGRRRGAGDHGGARARHA